MDVVEGLLQCLVLSHASDEFDSAPRVLMIEVHDGSGAFVAFDAFVAFVAFVACVFLICKKKNLGGGGVVELLTCCRECPSLLLLLRSSPFSLPLTILVSFLPRSHVPSPSSRQAGRHREWSRSSSSGRAWLPPSRSPKQRCDWVAARRSNGDSLPIFVVSCALPLFTPQHLFSTRVATSASRLTFAKRARR